MNTFRVAPTIGLLLATFLSAPVALAQTVCPVADEGDSCTGGTCIPASCTFATADGGSKESACGLCVEIGAGQCLASDDGHACGDGGTCHANGGGGGGAGGAGGNAGGPVEAGTLTGFSYGIGTCVIPHDGGAAGFGPDGAALAEDEDASGDDASADDASADDNDASTGGALRDASAAAHSTDAGATSTSSSSSGCGVASRTDVGALAAFGLLGAAVALSRRRRTTSND